MTVQPAITIQTKTLKVCPKCYGSSIYERAESYRSINCSDCGEIKTTTNQQRVTIDLERNRAELLLDVLDTYEQLTSSENNDPQYILDSAENLQLVDEMLEQLRQRLAVQTNDIDYGNDSILEGVMRPQYTHDINNPKPILRRCPVCESDNTEERDHDGGDDFYEVRFRCYDCDSTWSEIRQVTAIEYIKKGGES